MTLKGWQKVIHAWARGKGWWDDYPERLVVANRDHRAIVAEKLLLIHSEISEAVEEYRVGHPFTMVYALDSGGMPRMPASPDDKPLGFPTELADAMIRIFDLAEVCGVDLDAEVARKMEYNAKRPRRHGGKLL